MKRAKTGGGWPAIRYALQKAREGAAHRRLAGDDMLGFRQRLGQRARAGIPATLDSQP